MTHARHNDDVWSAIRGDYLDGSSQQRLADHYGVGRSTIRDRARREGWRRSDQPPGPITPIDAEPATDAEPMRPVVAVVADAYRMADIALRRGRLVEAQRCLTVARGFERLLSAEDWMAGALNDHWDGEADAFALAHQPPWPEGVEDADAARAELVREHALFDSLLSEEVLDARALVAGLRRAVRLTACLDIADRVPERENDDAPTAEPPNPPNPSNENQPTAWADRGGLPIAPSPCYDARE